MTTKQLATKNPSLLRWRTVYKELAERMAALENELAALSTRVGMLNGRVVEDEAILDVLGLFDLQFLQDPQRRNHNLRIIERLCRNAFLGNHITLCKVLGRFNMFVDTRDRAVGTHLMAQGYWEPQVTECISRLVKHGMRVIDVGANYGYYTLVMADLAGLVGHIHAVEANPHLVELLSDTMRINGMGGICKVSPVAVSKSEGVGWFVSDPKSSMNGHLVETCPVETSLNVFEVSITTLDNLVGTAEHVDFMKVDIEGAGECFFDAAKKTLSENRDIQLVCEVNAARYADPIEFFAKLRRFCSITREIMQDGSVAVVSDDQWILIPGDHMLMLARQ